MSTRAHVFVVIVTLFVVAFVIYLVRKRGMKSKYSLLWILISITLLGIVTFPNLYDQVSESLGIQYPPATILFISVAILFMVVVHFSWELSRLEERSRVLAEELALLRRQVEAIGGEEETSPTGGDGQSADNELQSADGEVQTSPELE